MAIFLPDGLAVLILVLTLIVFIASDRWTQRHVSVEAYTLLHKALVAAAGAFSMMIPNYLAGGAYSSLPDIPWLLLLTGVMGGIIVHKVATYHQRSTESQRRHPQTTKKTA